MPEGTHRGNHITQQQVQSKLGGLGRKGEGEGAGRSQAIKAGTYRLLCIQFSSFKLTGNSQHQPYPFLPRICHSPQAGIPSPSPTIPFGTHNDIG